MPDKAVFTKFAEAANRGNITFARRPGAAILPVHPANQVFYQNLEGRIANLR